MIKLAICDDEEKELNSTKEMCNQCLLQHKEWDVKISVFTSAQELLNDADSKEMFDIVLLDIYMPGMTGIELAKTIREINGECQIVFLTTSNAHAVEAFSLHAAHYLVKPYTIQQLNDALTKAVTEADKINKAYITMKVPGGVAKIYFKNFLYSETERHLQSIHLTDGKYIQVRNTSTELFEMLNKDKRFFKCGSTYIINLELVEEITAQSVLFENGDKIPTQRRQYKELLEQYTRFSLEGF